MQDSISKKTAFTPMSESVSAKNSADTTVDLKEIYKDICLHLQTIFGDRLEAVILYGSYARGDFDEESDIDIAVLAKGSREVLSKYRKAMAEEITRCMMTYGVLVSLTEISTELFDKYKTVLPFYRNIAAEGVRLSA